MEAVSSLLIKLLCATELNINTDTLDEEILFIKIQPKLIVCCDYIDIDMQNIQHLNKTFH